MDYVKILIVMLYVSACTSAAPHKEGKAGKDVFKKGNCRALRHRFAETIERSKCKPRDTMVDLPQRAPHILVFPNRVAVKRCDGFCSDGARQSCRPVTHGYVTFAIREKDIRTGRERCGTTRVLEHTACAC